MQEVVGSNPTEGKICFSQITLFYRVECEKLFCKTNIKLTNIDFYKYQIIQPISQKIRNENKTQLKSAMERVHGIRLKESST